jgi:hypothetical protein
VLCTGLNRLQREDEHGPEHSAKAENAWRPPTRLYETAPKYEDYFPFLPMLNLVLHINRRKQKSWCLRKGC